LFLLCFFSLTQMVFFCPETFPPLTFDSFPPPLPPPSSTFWPSIKQTQLTGLLIHRINTILDLLDPFLSFSPAGGVSQRVFQVAFLSFSGPDSPFRLPHNLFLPVPLGDESPFENFPRQKTWTVCLARMDSPPGPFMSQKFLSSFLTSRFILRPASYFPKVLELSILSVSRFM